MNNLRTVRQLKGITQEELANKMGRSQGYTRLLEVRSSDKIDPVVKHCISKILGVNEATLFSEISETIVEIRTPGRGQIVICGSRVPVAKEIRARKKKNGLFGFLNKVKK